jgi:hypothetical protein
MSGPKTGPRSDLQRGRFGTADGPAPTRGLAKEQFTQRARGGLGDGHNSFAHSMAWFQDKLYLGTTRSNLCMLRVQTAYVETPLEVWPVDCPTTMDGLYTLDRRSQIWCFDPRDGSWEMLLQSPMVEGNDGRPVPREIGYRSMEVFHGTATEAPALYVSTWAPGRAPGGLILRCTDGRTFEPVTPYGVADPPFSTTRSLTTFQGRLHFAPTAQRGQTGGQQNIARPQVLASATPEAGDWEAVNEPAFGDAGNLGIFSLATAAGQLYAGTLNTEGLQIWATDGSPLHGPKARPANAIESRYYRWRKICDKGAGRGPLNQAVASMTEFKGALYVGTGIQGGGVDRVNKVGPAAAEILRVNPDDSVDLIVGDRSDEGIMGREPLSGLSSGFGNFFNGYMWAMGEHDGWLYVGTYDWSVTLRWAKFDGATEKVQTLMQLVGTEAIIDADGGADLWRTADGENWLPVTKRGFGNAYNWGIRNIVSTPIGLFVGTANVFGPTVAIRDAATDTGWGYIQNPDGGLEVWQGHDGQAPPVAELLGEG